MRGKRKERPMSKIRMKPRVSNWETVAFILIHQITGLTGKHFTRIQLMSSQNITMAIDCLVRLNHKTDPEHPEASLQHAIQKLRNKGYIIFHGDGNYELTDAGIDERDRIMREMNLAQPSDLFNYVEQTKIENEKELTDKILKLFKNMSKEQIQSALSMVNKKT